MRSSKKTPAKLPSQGKPAKPPPQVSGVLAHVDNTQGEISKTEDQLTQLKQQIDQAKADCAKIEVSIGKVSSEIDALNCAREGLLAIFRMKIDGTKTLIDNIDDKILKKEKNLARFNGQHAQAKAKTQEIESEIDALNRWRETLLDTFALKLERSRPPKSRWRKILNRLVTYISLIVPLIKWLLNKDDPQ